MSSERHPEVRSADRRRGRFVVVHDFAYHYGGAERVTEALGEAFPNADVLVIGGHSHVLRRMGIADRASTILPMDRWAHNYRALSPVFPLLLSTREADVVVSSSYAFAHHVRGRHLHVEYCHSPLRQIWVSHRDYERAEQLGMAIGMKFFRPWLRWRDRRAAARVNLIVASCENVRARVRAFYGRDARVLYPPVATDVFCPAPVERDQRLALLVARLVEPYKAVSSVLAAFSRLPYDLVIVGDGRDAGALRARAPSNVRFAGQLADDELRQWYSRAAVVVFPGQDDFGIVPVEAMSCGTPVVALDAGGARETVVHGVTGLRFPPGALRGAIETAMERQWDHDRIREHALQFDKRRFVTEIAELVLQRADDAASMRAHRGDAA